MHLLVHKLYLSKFDFKTCNVKPVSSALPVRNLSKEKLLKCTYMVTELINGEAGAKSSICISLRPKVLFCVLLLPTYITVL